MTAAEFSQTQRQLAVAAQPIAEDQDVPRAVHRLQCQHFFVATLGEEHVLAEILPMARSFPQAAVEQQGRLDLLIAGSLEADAQIVLDDPVQRPPLRVPEDAADRLLPHMKEVELAPEPAVVPTLGFLKPEEVLVEFVLAGPGGAVDALQLGVALVAAPIGARHVHQLECLSETTGRGQMRAGAQIDKIALTIDADLFGFRYLADVLGLVDLTDRAEIGNRGVPVPDLAGDGLVAAHDLVHPRLDFFEILRCEGLAAGEIVIKAGLRSRAEGDLSIGIELLDRFGHDMRSVVAQDLKSLRAIAGDHRERGVVVDDGSEVARPAIEADGDRCLGKPRSDRCSDIAAADRSSELKSLSVWQGDDNRRPFGGRFCFLVDGKLRLHYSVLISTAKVRFSRRPAPRQPRVPKATAITKFAEFSSM